MQLTTTMPRSARERMERPAMRRRALVLACGASACLWLALIAAVMSVT